MNQKSDITFVLPRDESTHEQLLHLLGDAAIDIVLECFGTRYNKNVLDVTQAYFYIAKKCGGHYKHEDFRDAGCSRFNVLIPLLLSGDGSHGLLLWDGNETYEGERVENSVLSGKYEFRMDEGLILGEGVEHSTCI